MSKKLFNLTDDVLFAISRVNEHIRFTTGTMGLTGTLGTGTISSPHIRAYNHWTSGSISGGFYQSVFDRDSSSISANHLYDITFGLSVSSSFIITSGDTSTNDDEKIRIYRQFAATLLGRPEFLFTFQGVQRNELIFICLDRNQYKDEIKRGTFEIETVFSGNMSEVGTTLFEKRKFTDRTAISIVEETAGGPRGFLTLESGLILSGVVPTSSLTGSDFGRIGGAVYYDAGTIVLIPEVISSTSGTVQNHWWFSGGTSSEYENLAKGKPPFTFENLISGVRQRILQLDFRNQTNIRTTFYTCVAERDEFNYSPNASFTDDFGEIITTSGSDSFQSITYISRIGLLGQNDEVIAVGSLNRPVRKDPTLRVEIKVRLDY